MPASPPHQGPKRNAATSLPYHSRLNNEDSLDDTIELLTGFTTRQLQSITQLVSARVDHALAEQTPASPTPKDQADQRSLPNTRSMNETVSSQVKAGIMKKHRPPPIITKPRSTTNALDGNYLQPSPTTNSRIRDPMHPALRQESAQPAGQSSGVATWDFQPTPSPLSPPPSASTQPSSVTRTQARQVNANDLVLQHEVRYLSVHPTLPASAPGSHPHIVDIATISESFPQRGLGLADLVITILYKYDRYTLDMFLNLSKKRFLFKRTLPARITKVPYIERDAKFVTVGVSSHDGKTVEESITYRIIDGATGPWTPLLIRGPRSQVVHGAKNLDEYVRNEFAKNIMAQRVWEKKDGAKFTVSWK